MNIRGGVGVVIDNFQDQAFAGSSKSLRKYQKAYTRTSTILMALPKHAEGSWGDVKPRRFLIGGNWKSNVDIKFVNSFPH